MTIDTPGGPIVLHDSKDSLSAYRYMRFNQAQARANGLGTDIYDSESHLARMGLFMRKDELPSLAGEYNNLLLGLDALMNDESLLAGVLAPLVVSLNGQACPDTTVDGLKATAAAVLATEITQAALERAVKDSKKNFSPN
jgi:hypothetical protein